MTDLLVISSYPEINETHSSKTVGVASYTKNLLGAMKIKVADSSILVLAEKFEEEDKSDNLEKTVDEEMIEIERVWIRNNPFSMRNIYKSAKKEKSRDTLVSFEINMFGNALCTIFALWQIIKIKFILKSNVTFIMHQVVGNFEDLQGRNLKSIMLNLISRMFYLIVKVSANKIIVFEEQLRTNLGFKKNVFVVPHYIKEIEGEKLRNKSTKDEFIVFYFGYLAPYKGVLELLKVWPNELNYQGKDITLVIGGGANPNKKNDKSNTKYVNEVEKAAQEKNIRITGFIPEAQMNSYLSNCDVMIFPYKSFLSSSGPLALAFAYEKPAILSKQLSPYAKTTDFAKNLASCKLDINDITFEFSENAVKEKILFALDNKSRLIDFDQKMMNSRNINKTAGDVWDLIKKDPDQS